VALDSKTLRWALVGLYAAVVVGLLGLSYAGGAPEWLILGELEGEVFWTIFVLFVTVLSQALFLFATGTVNLCRPVRRPRLVAPVAVAGVLLTVLVFGGAMALAELFEFDSFDPPALVMWTVIILVWLAWAAAFFVSYRQEERFHALRRMVTAVIAGSLVELLVSIPAHLIVSRRPGCFVGLGTSIGLTCGVLVMLWAFGPGIVILFLRERYRRERREHQS
jgi:hypothetical protein